MKDVWILYDRKDYEINTEFVKMFEEAFIRNSNEFRIRLVFTEDLMVCVKDGKTCFGTTGLLLDRPAFVIARNRDFRISRMFERAGIRVFNSSFVSEICNDKAVTYQEVSKLGIPVTDTWFDCIPDEPAYPYVMKPTDGHGGLGVTMVHNEEEKDRFLKQWGMGCDALSKQRGHFVVQKPVSDLGKDVRVYVCGGNIIQAMLRESAKDFRSNFCLGGTAGCYQLNEQEISYVMKLQKHFGFDFAGIDFIFDKGKAVFNEIEDVVGSRMLYQKTDIDIIDIYTKYMISEKGKEIT